MFKYFYTSKAKKLNDIIFYYSNGMLLNQMYSIDKCCFKEKYANIIPANANVLINGCKFFFHKEIAVKKYDFWNKYFLYPKSNEVDICGLNGPIDNKIIDCAILLMYDDVVFLDFCTKIDSDDNIRLLFEYNNFLYDLLYVLDIWGYIGKYPEYLIKLIEKSLNFYQILGSIVKSIIFNSDIKENKYENYHLIASKLCDCITIDFKIFNSLYPFSSESIYCLNVKTKSKYEKQDLIILENIINLIGKSLSYTSFSYLYNYHNNVFQANIDDYIYDLAFCIYKDKKKESEPLITKSIDKIISMSMLNKKFFLKMHQ